MSYSQVGRVERGALPSASVGQLARIGAEVGLDVRVRAYPGPAPLRDAGQLALTDRLRDRLHTAVRFRTEVPLAVESDQRAWDGVLSRFTDGGAPLRVEAETRIHDAQAQLRRISLNSGMTARSTSCSWLPTRRETGRPSASWERSWRSPFRFRHAWPWPHSAGGATPAARHWSSCRRVHPVTIRGKEAAVGDGRVTG